MYRQSEKNLLNSNTSSTCPDNMVNFGLLTAEICWRVWGTPATFSWFRILAALLHGTLVVRVSRNLRRWTEGAAYIFGRAATTLGIGPHSSLIGNTGIMRCCFEFLVHKCYTAYDKIRYNKLYFRVPKSWRVQAMQLSLSYGAKNRSNEYNLKQTRNVGQCPTWWPPCRI